MPPTNEQSEPERNPIESIASDVVDSIRVGKKEPLEPLLESHPDHGETLRELMPLIARLEQARKSQSKELNGLASLGADRPERLGDFELVRQIGRGGMGVVFEAIQRSLGRRVAVKVLPKSLLIDDIQLKRFEREARTAAALHHTNIVPVFGVGEDQGFHYYVMQCIDGRGLDRVISEGGDRELSPMQVAWLGQQAASALDYAHAQKVLHRDIKPANLIVNGDHDLWVTDFGVSKAIESEAMTRTGDIVGTLRYMAPEQIIGVNDFRSDIFSLGVTLYELLAGRPAMDDASIRSAIVARRPITSPPSLRQLNPNVPKDLETILHTAMAIDPTERYQSAIDLANDLERFAKGETISVRPLSFVESSLRWARRNPAVAGLSVVSLALLLGVAVLSLTGYLRSQELLHREQLARNNAEQTTEMAADALDQVFQRFAVSPQGRGNTPSQTKASSQFAAAPSLSSETARLLEDLVRYFDAFASRAEANPKLRRSADNARSSIGDIYLQLGQYQQAIDRFQSSLKSLSPSAADRNLLSARLYNRIGYAHKMLGDQQAADTQYQRAVAMLSTKMSSSKETDDLIEFELARSYFLLGMRVEPGMRPSSMPPPMALETALLDPRGGQPKPPPDRSRGPKSERDIRPSDAQRDYLFRSLKILRELSGSDQHNVAYAVALASCLRQLAGESFTRRSEKEAAYENEAIEILRKLHNRHPSDTTVTMELAAVLASGTVYEMMDHDDHVYAVDRFREAVKYLDLLATSHPNVPQYNNALVHSLFRLGVLLERMSQDREGRRQPRPSQRDWETEAGDAFQQAAMRHAVLLRQHPGEVGYQAWDAVFLFRYGALLTKLGVSEQAEVVLSESIATWTKLCDDHPEHEICWVAVPIVYATLSIAQDQMGQREAARRSMVEADLADLLWQIKKSPAGDH